MYTIFKQTKGSTVAYSYRKMSGKSNSHIYPIGNRMYVNKVHPEILPMEAVSDGFSSVRDVLLAIGYLIVVDIMRGVNAYKATPHRPALRV